MIPKRVYISTPLKPGKFQLGLIQDAIFANKVFAFIPPTEEKNDKVKGSATDKLQIELCDELWVFGAIGNDCSWEIGYAQALRKPVVIFMNDTNKHILENDWMLFSAPHQIVKPNE